jgi:rare lipoprotein A (peptidoglycan hydrolase)
VGPTRRGIALVLVTSLALALRVSPPIARVVAAETSLPSPGSLPSASGSTASSLPGAIIGPGTVPIPADLDEATKRALELEDRIQLVQQDAIALEQRIAVVNIRIFGQENSLSQAQGRLDAARARFNARLVDMYKSGLASPVLLLFTARSLSDFYARVVMLSRIVSEDVAAYRDAELASREADYAASVLDDMKAQLLQLRLLYDNRLAEAKRALADEHALIATLSAASRELVAERKAASEETRKEWRASSIGIGTPIRFVPALLETSGESYLVAEYQPTRYASLGQTFVAVCSWYGNEFNGRPTASGQIFNQDDLTCASRTLPFGTRIALTREDRRVIVVVTDRGPFVSGRDLDLSRAAARALGFSGVEAVSAVYVRPSQEATSN